MRSPWYFLILGLFFTLGPASGQAPAKVKLVKLDLSKAGDVDDGIKKAPWALTIEAPQGATAKLYSINTNILVEKGDGFKLSIGYYRLGDKTAKEQIANKKKDWQKDKGTKGLVVDTEDTLVREVVNVFDTKKTAFQFMTIMKVGDKVYYGEGPIAYYKFSKADVDLMLKSAKTLAAK
jgi:hypothetical protein